MPSGRHGALCVYIWVCAPRGLQKKKNIWCARARPLPGRSNAPGRHVRFVWRKLVGSRTAHDGVHLTYKRGTQGWVAIRPKRCKTQKGRNKTKKKNKQKKTKKGECCRLPRCLEQSSGPTDCGRFASHKPFAVSRTLGAAVFSNGRLIRPTQGIDRSSHPICIAWWPCGGLNRRSAGAAWIREIDLIVYTP